MAYHYVFAVIDVMRDEDGIARMMSDGKTRYGETQVEISPMRSLASAICRTLGLAEDFELLRAVPGNAVQVPVSVVARARFAQDGQGQVSINGEDYGDSLSGDRIDDFVAMQRALQSPTARLFLRME